MLISELIQALQRFQDIHKRDVPVELHVFTNQPIISISKNISVLPNLYAQKRSHKTTLFSVILFGGK